MRYNLQVLRYKGYLETRELNLRTQKSDANSESGFRLEYSRDNGGIPD